jgi:hypothetical protein
VDGAARTFRAAHPSPTVLARPCGTSVESQRPEKNNDQDDNQDQDQQAFHK